MSFLPSPASFFLIACALVSLLAATGLGALFAARGFPLPEKDKRVGCIDGLRGYLALSVMIHHFTIWLDVMRDGGPWAAPSSNFANQLGAGAVALFFMTTGFVFYPRILAGFSATSWRQVYVGRLFRIVPMVVISVCAVMLVIVVRGQARPAMADIGHVLAWITTWDQPALFGYELSRRVNAEVLWSLRWEWFFYLLLLPLCAIAIDRIRAHGWPTVALPLALLLAAILARGLLRFGGLEWAGLRYLPLFAVGMLAYEAQRSARVRALVNGRLAAVVVVAALLLGMAIAPYPYTIALPCFALFFIAVAAGNDLGGILATRGALVLGECSFSIYLMHGLFLNVAFMDGARFVSAMPAGVRPALLPPLMLAVAAGTAVTYLCVERPCIALGRRLAGGRRARKMPLSEHEREVAP